MATKTPCEFCKEEFTNIDKHLSFCVKNPNNKKTPTPSIKTTAVLKTSLNKRKNIPTKIAITVTFSIVGMGIILFIYQPLFRTIIHDSRTSFLNVVAEMCYYLF